MKKAIINGVLAFAIGLMLGSAGVTYRTWQYWGVMCGALAIVWNSLTWD